MHRAVKEAARAAGLRVRPYREEVLNAYLFHSTQEAQQLSDAWLVDYNERRPHDALGRVPPLTYLPRVSSPSKSMNSWSA